MLNHNAQCGVVSLLFGVGKISGASSACMPRLAAVVFCKASAPVAEAAPMPSAWFTPGCRPACCGLVPTDAEQLAARVPAALPAACNAAAPLVEAAAWPHLSTIRHDSAAGAAGAGHAVRHAGRGPAAPASLAAAATCTTGPLWGLCGRWGGCAPKL